MAISKVFNYNLFIWPWILFLNHISGCLTESAISHGYIIFHHLENELGQCGCSSTFIWPYPTRCVLVGHYTLFWSAAKPFGTGFDSSKPPGSSYWNCFFMFIHLLGRNAHDLCVGGCKFNHVSQAMKSNLNCKWLCVCDYLWIKVRIKVAEVQGKWINGCFV